jgi:hypothetical protein
MSIGVNGIQGAPALGGGGVAGSATGFVPSVPGSSVPSYTPGTGSADADGAYLLATADTNLPNSIVYLPALCQSTAPTVYNYIWIDTSTTPATPNYWSGSAWVPWPDVTSITFPIAATNISCTGLPWSDVQDALAGILAQILAVNHIISGGVVTNVAGTYEFDITAAVYCIGGFLFSSAAQSVTLAGADPTYNRYDVLYLDNTGTFGVIEGTASASPVAPSVDPTSQLAVLTVPVAAASTAASVTTILVYDEDAGAPGEWNGTTDGGGTIVLNSTNGSPEHGSYDIEATATAVGDFAKWVSGAGTVTLSSNAVLTFWIKSKAAWGAGMRLSLRLQDGSSSVGQVVALQSGTYGFNSATTASWQEISVPITAFGANGVPFDTLKVSVAVASGGTPATIGFYLDWFQLTDTGASGAPLSFLVGVDTSDAIPGPGNLFAKIAAGAEISTEVVGVGGNEQVQVTNTEPFVCYPSSLPSGTINGVNTSFTLAHTPVNGIGVFADHLRMDPTTDYSVSGTALTMVAAPVSALVVDIF